MLAISCIATLAMILSACGAPSTNNQQGNSAGTPVKGGTWVDDLYEEPDSLIPNASSETFAWMVDNTIWTPLFYGDAAGHITPGLVAQVPTLQNGGISHNPAEFTSIRDMGLAVTALIDFIEKFDPAEATRG